MSEEAGGGVLLIPPTKELVHTNLVDTHQSKQSIHKDLLKTGEDLGEGFTMQDEPVLVQRDQRGEIVKLTPLSELPGVEYEQAAPPVEADLKRQPTPVKMSRSDKRKFHAVLARRLFNHYSDLDPGYPGFNPLRDGIPVDPVDRHPMALQPDKTGAKLKYATAADVYRYLKDVVAQRATVIEKKNGTTGIMGQAVRIE